MKLDFLKRNFYFGKEEKRKKQVSSQVSHSNGVVTD